jgi:hypothetical protein
MRIRKVYEKEFTVRLDQADNEKFDAVSKFFKLSLADTLRRLIRDKKISP